MSVECNKNITALVPVLNEGAILKPFLERLREIGIAEIIVADGGSEDDSFSIATELADMVAKSPPGRGRQIARAAQHATSEIFWIVHCDSQPPFNALSEIKAIMANDEAVMGAFPISFDSNHPLLRLYGFLSRFDSPLTTFGDQGFFLRAEDYRRSGGISDLALFEDVEIRRHLCRTGKVIKSKSSLKTSARQFRKHGIFLQQVKNAYLLARYFAGASPNALAQSYYTP